MTNEDRASLHAQIIGLQQKLTGNLMEDLVLRDKIHNLQMKLNGVKPMDTSVYCVGCGS